MSEVRVKENESLDSALRRFKRSCAKSGVLAEVRKREHYEKPSSHQWCPNNVSKHTDNYNLIGKGKK